MDATVTAPPAGFTTLTLDVTDGIATVRLDRPDDANAIDVPMARDLSEVATRLAEDPSSRCSPTPRPTSSPACCAA
jgi:hypothetical protein